MPCTPATRKLAPPQIHRLAAVLLAAVTLVAPAHAQQVVRTGDPYARGFTDNDFPRVQRIADGVYTYERRVYLEIDGRLPEGGNR